LKKPAPGKAAAAGDEFEGDEDIGKVAELPDGDFIKSHIRSLQALKTKARSIAGEIGAAVKAAESDKNVHRGAAAFALKLANMDEETRDEFLRHFDSYRLQLGFGRQDDLFNDPSPVETATFAGRA
jgi:hypothetical protein